MKSCYLAIEKESLQKAIYRLTGPTTIGRSPDNTVSLQDPTVSRSHARLSLQEGGWTVEDLESANGIIFDGHRVDKVVLNSGDVFQIGNTTFRFIEKEISKERDQLSETIEILSASIEDQGLPDEKGGAETWWQRLQNSIAAIQFFDHLGETEREMLADYGTLCLFNAGETIIREGDTGRSIYVILDGKVKVVTRDYRGEELELATLGLSQFFGEMSFLTGEPRSSSVIPRCER